MSVASCPQRIQSKDFDTDYQMQYYEDHFTGLHVYEALDKTMEAYNQSDRKKIMDVEKFAEALDRQDLLQITRCLGKHSFIRSCYIFFLELIADLIEWF